MKKKKEKTPKKEGKPRAIKTRKAKLPKTRNMNTWSDAEYFSRIRSALRRVFRYYKPMQEALKLASRPSQDTNNKRLKTEYQCNCCKKWFKRADVEIDHIEELGELRKYEDVVPFIQKLTVEDPSAYQILCKKDHLVKTHAARDKRKQLRSIKTQENETGNI